MGALSRGPGARSCGQGWMEWPSFSGQQPTMPDVRVWFPGSTISPVVSVRHLSPHPRVPVSGAVQNTLGAGFSGLSRARCYWLKDPVGGDGPVARQKTASIAVCVSLCPRTPLSSCSACAPLLGSVPKLWWNSRHYRPGRARTTFSGVSSYLHIQPCSPIKLSP